MAYSTVADLQTSYPRMEKSSVSSATINRFLERASNYIDGYIADVVSLPIVTVPPLIKDICEDLAYVMFLRRFMVEANKDRTIDKAWDDALNRLENIRNGTVVLVDASGAEVSSTSRDSAPWSSVSGYTPTFGLSDIEDSEIDEDRQDDEDDLRD